MFILSLNFSASDWAGYCWNKYLRKVSLYLYCGHWTALSLVSTFNILTSRLRNELCLKDSSRCNFQSWCNSKFFWALFTSVWPHIMMNQVMLCCVSGYFPMDSLNWGFTKNNQHLNFFFFGGANYYLGVCLREAIKRDWIYHSCQENMRNSIHCGRYSTGNDSSILFFLSRKTACNFAWNVLVNFIHW